MALLEASGIGKNFGETKVLKDISLNLEQGEALAIIGSSGSGKTRFWLTPQLLQAHSSYVVVDPKGGVLGQVGAFLQRRGYQIKVFNSIDFSKSMHYNPLSYIRNEADILKFVNALITNTKGARPDRA